MAMQIPVAIVLVQGRCVIIGVVLCLGRCYVLIEPCDFRNNDVTACIDYSFFRGQARNPNHNVDRQRITPLAMRRHRRHSIRTIVQRFLRGSQMMIDDRRWTLPLGIMIDCPGTLMQRILHNSQHANRDLNVAASQPPARRTNALMASPATRTPMAPVPALRAPFATRTTFGCPRDVITTAACEYAAATTAARPMNDGCPRGVVHRLLAR